MRDKIAVAVSLVFFCFFYFGSDMAADALGVPMYIDGAGTGVGVCLILFSILLAWRVYHWVVSGKVHGNIPKESHITWLFWLLSLLAFILSATIIRHIEVSSVIQRIAVLGSGVFIAWVAYKKHAETMRKRRSRSSDHT
jgi:hypothetical protein